MRPESTNGYGQLERRWDATINGRADLAPSAVGTMNTHHRRFTGGPGWSSTPSTNSDAPRCGVYACARSVCDISSNSCVGASGASADPGRPDISKILTLPLRLNKGVEEIAAESCSAHYNGITVRWAARPVGIGNCGDALHSLRRRRWKRRPWAMWIHSHVRARPTNCTESPQASQHQYYDAIIGPLSEY